MSVYPEVNEKLIYSLLYRSNELHNFKFHVKHKLQCMPQKLHTELLKELKKIDREVRLVKDYLKTLIELNLEQIKEVEPTLSEKRVLKNPVRKEEFLDWERVKDGI